MFQKRFSIFLTSVLFLNSCVRAPVWNNTLHILQCASRQCEQLLAETCYEKPFPGEAADPILTSFSKLFTFSINCTKAFLTLAVILAKGSLEIVHLLFGTHDITVVHSSFILSEIRGIEYSQTNTKMFGGRFALTLQIS